MPLPKELWQVDITDFKFNAYGETWCLSIEYESADDGYTPLLSLRVGLAWQSYAMWMGGHVRNSEELLTKFGSPAAYLQAVCAWVTDLVRNAGEVPLPETGNALSRALYHVRKSLTWDGEKLVSPSDLVP